MGSRVGQRRRRLRYDIEGQALAAVAEAIRRNGRQSVGAFGLLRVNSRGRGKLLAEGDALAERALAAEAVLGPVLASA